MKKKYMNKIRICERNQIPQSQLQYFSPVHVEILKEAGYNVDGVSSSEIVYLDAESYKAFMNSQFIASSTKKINNYYTPEEINNIYPTYETRRKR